MTTATQIFNTTKNIEVLAEQVEYERVGSLIFWEFPIKRSINHNLGEIKKVFDGTYLKEFLQPVGLSECIRRFADSVIVQHGNLYGRKLNYLIEKDKANPGYYYLSFYTGKIDDKKGTNFTEHAKIWLSEDNCILLDKDATFLIQSYNELHSELAKNWKITHKDVMDALGRFSNAIGYRFNSHGGHYFIPHKYTEELYKIKKILSEFGQLFSITPLIAGTDEDVEEIVKLLGGEFKKDLEKAEKELFEQCIQIYNFQHHWNDYVDAVEHRVLDEVQANKISQTKYGRKLTAKILTIDGNASLTEYQSIVKEYLAGIKPNKNKSISKIYTIRDNLKAAITKLDTATESKLINKWRNQMLEDLYQVNQTLEKTSKLLVDEMLSVI